MLIFRLDKRPSNKWIPGFYRTLSRWPWSTKSNWLDTRGMGKTYNFLFFDNSHYIFLLLLSCHVSSTNFFCPSSWNAAELKGPMIGTKTYTLIAHLHLLVQEKHVAYLFLVVSYFIVIVYLYFYWKNKSYKNYF